MLRRLLPVLLLAPTVVSAETLAIDPVHTRVMVAASHAGFSQAMGVASGSHGQVDYDDGWANAKVDVTVRMQKLDFGDAGWNRAVLKLLDADRFTEAHFVSERVTPRDANHAEICGTLTLHGVSKPLCMDATLNALKRHPMPPFRRTAGFSATAKLDRFDYGITEWPTVIGREVELRIEIEASRGIGAPKADTPSEPEPVETPTP
ncbi:YceI family protein [Cognatilysobacter terrigena]|uniref:YceI family protein n=1 Tax=Cognatilysobacter terrigena TaxID=2488749 RepID=UPI00105E7F60|nr:YceI family protein [Lysobacter terrigena]